ncbi:hypothetical protein AAE485_14155 (plasmid) [Acidithiobacillus ferriphilus]|uniref:hypothetical protein n=1 Tax=Acidithiobacillus ferriphilus TaxID=1689834 RepID=UPI00390CC142
MPKFKKITYSVENKAGAKVELAVDINIDANGIFYATLPLYIKDAVDPSHIHHGVSVKDKDKFRVQAPTFETLDRVIRASVHAYAQPDVTETPVILYLIESHVAFAEDENGHVCPNAGWTGARWNQDERFGNHHSSNLTQGYSLSVGARAMLKITHRYGSTERVEYRLYYKGDSHLGQDNPAQLLNSWGGFSLGRSPKEIPYSDEAALFFHSLMMGMAEMSRKIQDATFDQERLMQAIAQSRPGFALLPGAMPELEDVKSDG